MESPVEYALVPSKRFDRLPDGRPGPPVGFDVYAITGHTQVGETVFLTMKLVRWVRYTDSLTDMGKET